MQNVPNDVPGDAPDPERIRQIAYELDVQAVEIRHATAQLARDYLVRGVIMGAASIGVSVAVAEVEGALFDPHTDPDADEAGELGVDRLHALIRRKRAAQGSQP